MLYSNETFKFACFTISPALYRLTWPADLSAPSFSAFCAVWCPLTLKEAVCKTGAFVLAHHWKPKLARSMLIWAWRAWWSQATAFAEARKIYPNRNTSFQVLRMHFSSHSSQRWFKYWQIHFMKSLVKKKLPPESKIITVSKIYFSTAPQKNYSCFKHFQEDQKKHEYLGIISFRQIWFCWSLQT